MAAIGGVIAARRPTFVCLQVPALGWGGGQGPLRVHRRRAACCVQSMSPSLPPSLPTSGASFHRLSVSFVQEVTPHIYHLFQRSPWWPAYYASNCPAGAPYFTTLLALRDAVQGAAGSFAEIPYENSIMGGWVEWVGGVGDGCQTAGHGTLAWLARLRRHGDCNSARCEGMAGRRTLTVPCVAGRSASMAAEQLAPRACAHTSASPPRCPRRA